MRATLTRRASPADLSRQRERCLISLSGMVALESHDKHVAMRRSGQIRWLDSGDTMKHPRIVDERRIERLDEREAAEEAPLGRVNGRRALGNVGASDHQHEHV